MPDFTIHISTPADLSGAQATQAAIAALTQAAGQLATNAGKAAGSQQGAAQAAAALGSAAASASKNLSDAEREAGHLWETLKLGVGIDIGHRIVEGVAEIPHIYQEALQEGVRYNASVETLTIQLAGALRSADPGRYLDFAQARTAGAEALDLLREKANLLGTDFHALAETFAVNVPVLAKAGIKDVQDQIDTIVLLNQVAASKGIGGFQAQRDIIDILNGQGNRTLLGKELETQGVSNESIKNAERLGNLYDFLKEKQGAYGEAGAAAANTFTAAQQRLRNETEQLYGQISKPVFDELKTQYDAMAAEIVKPEVEQSLARFGIAAGDAVKVAGGLTRFAVEYAGVLSKLGEVLGLVTLALSVNKAAELLAIIPARLGFIVEETAAITAQTGALALNTAAKEASAGAALGAGVTGAGVLGNAGTLLAGGVGGFLGGRALREWITHEQADTAQEISGGEAAQKDTGRVGEIADQIRAAQTDEDKLAARKALEEEIEAITKRVNDLKGKAADLDESDRGVLNGQIGLGEQQLKNATDLQTRFFDIAGTRAKTLTGEQEIEESMKDQAATAKELQKTLTENAKLAGEVQADVARHDFEALNPAQQLAQLSKVRDNLRRDLHSVSFGDASDTPANFVSRIQESDATPEEKNAKLVAAKDLETTLGQIEKLQASINKDAADAAKSRIDEIQKHDDVLKNAQAENAITRAKAAGQDDLVKKLEDEVKVRQLIRQLMSSGNLRYDEAQPLAEARVRDERAAADRDDQDHGLHLPERARRDSRERDRDRDERDGRGRRRGYTISGYHDPNHDADGGLHGGGLTSSGLTSSGLGGGSLGPSSASIALGGLPGVNFNQLTATQALAPSAAVSVAGTAAAIGQDSPNSKALRDIADKVTKSGGKNAEAVRELAIETGKLAVAIEKTSPLGGLDARIPALQQEVRKLAAVLDNLQGQASNRS